MYWANRSLSEPWFTLSAVAYSILILITFLGNSLVIWAVARRKELWNPRNIFILNLAVSDICKCTGLLVIPQLGFISSLFAFGWMLCEALKMFPQEVL